MGINNNKANSRAKHGTGPRGPGTGNQWMEVKQPALCSEATVWASAEQEDLLQTQLLPVPPTRLTRSGINYDGAAERHSWQSPTTAQQADAKRRTTNWIHKPHSRLQLSKMTPKMNKQHRETAKQAWCTKASWSHLLTPAACSSLCQTPCCTSSLLRSLKLTGLSLTSGRGDHPKKSGLWQTYKGIILSWRMSLCILIHSDSSHHCLFWCVPFPAWSGTFSVWVHVARQ